MPTRILKKYTTSYLSHKVIFAMDVLLGTFASLVSAMSLYLLPISSEKTSSFVLIYTGIGFATSFISELCFRSYKYTIRHMTLSDIFRLAGSAIFKVILLTIVAICMSRMSVGAGFFLTFDFFATLFLLIGCRVVMVMVYNAYRESEKSKKPTEDVLIYGTKTKAASLVTRLINSDTYSVAGFISSTPVEKGIKLCDKPVFYFDTYEDFLAFCKKRGVASVLFAHENEAMEESDGLVRFCSQNDIKVLIAPSVDEISNGKIMQGKVREIKIEDLLGREEIKLNLEEIKKNFGGKVVMVTGAAGSIGSELVRQLATFGVRQLVLFDNAETPMHNLRLELEEKFPNLDFVPVIGDVRLIQRLDYAFCKWKPQVVFHAAAYKHVPLMEENPCEAVLVNVAGSRNVADKCIEYGVEKMVMISTDKAVNPTNIMGCTKRLAEIYVQSLGLAIERGEVEGKTKFVTTRFGNVLGSNGSVIPRFREQIEKGGPVTVTHPDIIRFFMTIPEACRLVMEAATMTDGNQIFVFDMGKAMKIDTLARKMIELAKLRPDIDIKIEYTGLRPGEKLYEEVLSNAESTDPTSHDRIRVARVREYAYAEASEGNHELERLSREVDIPTMVQLMKSIVPEFISRNSRFSVYDRPSGN